MALVLVDTSVWIRAEKGLVVSEHVAIRDLAVCPVVVSEVLRGTRDQRHYEKSRTFLLLMQMLDASLTTRSSCTTTDTST